jgi:hypothetical protein
MQGESVGGDGEHSPHSSSVNGAGAATPTTSPPVSRPRDLFLQFLQLPRNRSSSTNNNNNNVKPAIEKVPREEEVLVKEAIMKPAVVPSHSPRTPAGMRLCGLEGKP